MADFTLDGTSIPLLRSGDMTLGDLTAARAAGLGTLIEIEERLFAFDVDAWRVWIHLCARRVIDDIEPGDPRLDAVAVLPLARILIAEQMDAVVPASA